jgi:polyphenol oxidase
MHLTEFCYEEIEAGIRQVKGFFPSEFTALQTTRVGGVSRPPYDSFNLAAHVGDEPKAVAENRARLGRFMPGEPVWLEQVHGCDSVLIVDGSSGAGTHTVVGLGLSGPRQGLKADASITSEPDQPCAVMTADCLPLLVARPAARQCAAIHAGWKGLAAGVIEKTLQRMRELAHEQGLDQKTAQARQNHCEMLGANTLPDTWYVWLGPAIGQGAFEVGPEVREKFVRHNALAGAAFLASPRRSGHFMASLAELALLRLQTFESFNQGCDLRVAVDRDSVFDSSQAYFSFRRNPQTGRMASLIFRRMGQKA